MFAQGAQGAHFGAFPTAYNLLLDSFWSPGHKRSVAVTNISQFSIFFSAEEKILSIWLCRVLKSGQKISFGQVQADLSACFGVCMIQTRGWVAHKFWVNEKRPLLVKLLWRVLQAKSSLWARNFQTKHCAELTLCVIDSKYWRKNWPTTIFLLLGSFLAHKNNTHIV